MDEGMAGCSAETWTGFLLSPSAAVDEGISIVHLRPSSVCSCMRGARPSEKPGMPRSTSWLSQE